MTDETMTNGNAALIQGARPGTTVAQALSRARFGVVLIVLLVGACKMIEVDVSHSLAHANVDVGDRIGDFGRMADLFARKNGFLITGGSYPRDGRQVVNIEIDTDKDRRTIMLMSNFRAENTLETNIYSSEGEERWKRIWLDFLQLASGEFGADHVKVVPVRTQ